MSFLPKSRYEIKKILPLAQYMNWTRDECMLIRKELEVWGRQGAGAELEFKRNDGGTCAGATTKQMGNSELRTYEYELRTDTNMPNSFRTPFPRSFF